MKLKERILVVDDSPEQREALFRILSYLHNDVDLAENGRIACRSAIRAMAEDRPYDLILMDLRMPVMDGCSATAFLRQHGYRGRIVAVTAETDARDDCLNAGCDEFVTKPITVERLEEIIEYGATARAMTSSIPMSSDIDEITRLDCI